MYEGQKISHEVSDVQELNPETEHKAYNSCFLFKKKKDVRLVFTIRSHRSRQ